MAEVYIEGVFMGAEVKSSTFDGVTKTNVVVDVYQAKSSNSDKTVSLKTDDVSIINVFNENYDFGSVIKVKASVNAYKNKAYFKLLEVV